MKRLSAIFFFAFSHSVQADYFRDAMLAEIFVPGDVLPSIRQRAMEQQINSLNVSKAFQILVHEGSVEKRRSLGMFLDGCAIGSLREVERQLFLNIELPAFKARVARLGYTLEELI